MSEVATGALAHQKLYRRAVVVVGFVEIVHGISVLHD